MCFTICAVHWVRQVGVLVSKGPAMSFTRKTLKILALIYFVLGIASLVTAGVGIATGGLDSTYGSYATLAAVVLIAKGLVDLAAASPVSRAPTSLRRWTARLSSVLLPRSPRLPKRCSRFPRLAATLSILAPLSSWCTTCSLFSRHTPLRPRTRTAYKRPLLITSAAKQLKRADRASPRSALYVCPDKTCQNKPVPFW